MSGPDGAWDLVIRTPVGRQQVLLLLDRDQAGTLTGTAASSAETVALDDLTYDGQRLGWSQSITRPMRLHLTFDLTLEGDQLHGHSRAGRLPRSTVTGQRRPTTPPA